METAQIIESAGDRLSRTGGGLGLDCPEWRNAGLRWERMIRFERPVGPGPEDGDSGAGGRHVARPERAGLRRVKSSMVSWGDAKNTVFMEVLTTIVANRVKK